MESTISTPSSRAFSVYSGTRLVLLSISRLPMGYAATTFTPASFGASSGFFGPLIQRGRKGDRVRGIETDNARAQAGASSAVQLNRSQQERQREKKFHAVGECRKCYP